MRVAAITAVFAFSIPCLVGQSTEQQLKKLEAEWNNAEVKKDVAVLNRVLAEDYTDTGPEGAIVTKAQTIASLKSGEDVIASCTLSEMKVRVYGDAAVALYRYQVKEKFKGQDVSGTYQITDVWVKRGAGWQLVASHASKVSNL